MIKQAIIDLKDTLYTEEKGVITPRDGAKELLSWMNEHEFPYAFCTNSTSRSIDNTLASLRESGLPAQGHIVDAVTQSVDYLRGQGIYQALLVSSRPDLRQRYEQEEVELLDAYDPSVENAAVLVAYDEHLDAAMLRHAINYLMKTDAQLVALNMNPNRVEGGLYDFNAGAITTLLEYATGRSHDKTAVMGKPTLDFFTTAANSLPGALGYTVMIGDNPEIDLRTPHNLNLPTILVRSQREFKDIGWIDWVVDKPGDIIPILEAELR